MAGPIPAIASRSSSPCSGPWDVLNAMMRCASAGPTPGKVSNSAWLAELTRTTPPEAPTPLPAPGEALPPGSVPDRAAYGPAGSSPAAGTRSCVPSTSRAAKLSKDRPAPRFAPPAALTASSTLAPSGRWYRPGRLTAPTTWTVSPGPAAGAEPAGLGAPVPPFGVGDSPAAESEGVSSAPPRPEGCAALGGTRTVASTTGTARELTWAWPAARRNPTTAAAASTRMRHPLSPQRRSDPGRPGASAATPRS